MKIKITLDELQTLANLMPHVTILDFLDIVELSNKKSANESN